MTKTIGIDLGTTNSVVAALDKYGKPVALNNSERRTTTPSVIAFTQQGIKIGEEAKSLQALNLCPIAAYFKREMGITEFSFLANNREYTATQLSALLLTKLKQDAEAELGATITHAVVTVPAYFKDPERKATIQAAKEAGLDVLQTINEPTAAAIASCQINQGKDRSILVYDLGGGTFDVTILRVKNSNIEVRTSTGDHQLGGKDWDERIVEFIGEKFRQEHGEDPQEDAEGIADLLVLAEETKKKLSSLKESRISFSYNGNRGKYTISRDEFDEITNDLMRKTIMLTKRTMDDLNIKASAIDEVLLVGGSTRMPMVKGALEKLFGFAPTYSKNVDEVVAEGAAIIAAQLAAKTHTGKDYPIPGAVKAIDVTNHSLGMIAVNAEGDAYLNSIILPKNRQLPCRETRPYQYNPKTNPELEIYLTQGETDDPQDPTYLGLYKVSGWKSSSRESTKVNVAYEYSDSGTVEVSAIEANTGHQLTVKVADLPYDVPARFQVAPETLAVQHMCVYIAIDLSGSMDGKPLANAKGAALAFLRETDLQQCSIGIIAFSDETVTKLQISQNARDIENAINALEVGETGYGNYTHPFDELLTLYSNMETRNYALVLADGVWTDQPRAIKQAKQCHREGIDIIAVGFGSADKQFLKDIASAEEVSFMTTQDKLAKTFSGIAQVLVEHGDKEISGKSAEIFSSIKV